MKRERSIRFLLFVVCMAAAVPLSWGAGGFKNLNPVGPAGRIEGVSTDVSTKVALCHVPPGNQANAHTIVVGQAAVAAHLAHGDSLGECPSACTGVPSPVPKTGQTGCWDADGTPIACAGTGQDGEYQFGASASPRFTDHGDGTVTDNLTGLIWLENANCFDFQNWTEALADANTLASGSCGLTDGSVARDWRLPNLKELQSLIDYSNIGPAFPTGNPFSFPGVQQPAFYWSSTTDVSYPSAAWYADGGNGRVVLDYKSSIFYVWPVRGGK